MKRTAETNNILEEIHDYCLDIQHRLIYLHDDFKDEGAGIDYRVATKFIKNLSCLESSEGDIIIHQHSCGGDVWAGMAIYDAIHLSNRHISVVCHGATMSMATIILQAADVRLSMPNCTFLFHQGSAGVVGTTKQVLSFAEWIKKDQDKGIDIFAERCQYGKFFIEKGYTKARVKQYIKSKFEKKEDWYIDAEEALAYGFIDKIVPPKGLLDIVT